MSHNPPTPSGNPTQQPSNEDVTPTEVQVPKVRPPLAPETAYLMTHEQFLRQFAVQPAGPTDAGNAQQEPEKQTVTLNVEAITERHNELALKGHHNWTDAEELEVRGIVAHCTALDLPVVCANTNPKPPKQDAPKPKQKRPYKRKVDTSKAATPSNGNGQIALPSALDPTHSFIGPVGATSSVTDVSNLPARTHLKHLLDRDSFADSGTDSGASPAKKAANNTHQFGIGAGGSSRRVSQDERARKTASNAFSFNAGAPDTANATPLNPGSQQQIPPIARYLGPNNHAYVIDPSNETLFSAAAARAGIQAALEHQQLLDAGVPREHIRVEVYGTYMLHSLHPLLQTRDERHRFDSTISHLRFYEVLINRVMLTRRYPQTAVGNHWSI